MSTSERGESSSMRRRCDAEEETSSTRRRGDAEEETSSTTSDLVEESRDPLSILGSELIEKILEFTDARSMARCIVLNQGWHRVASSDLLWAPRCLELWMGKAHIPRCSQVRGASRLHAYSMSVMDGKRVRITKEDLCDHVWGYRFQMTAPEYWRNLDPSWKHTGPPMRRYFHPDGSVTADPGDEVWGGHECTYSIITSYIGDGQIREHYVRINRWPPVKVSRMEDWSWEMANHLFCYNSLPDADKPGGTGPIFPVW